MSSIKRKTFSSLGNLKCPEVNKRDKVKWNNEIKWGRIDEIESDKRGEDDMMWYCICIDEVSSGSHT